MGPNNTARLVITLLILFNGASAQASVARAVAFDEKVQQADSIILGRCTGTRSAWDPSGRFILTYSTFQVEKALKGAAVPEITVVTPGGKVGSIRQETVGIPQFSPGEQNVLFVKRSAAGLTVAYFDQGAYRVAADPRGEVKVAPIASNLALVDPQSGVMSGREPIRSLREFEGAVRTSLVRSQDIQRYGVAKDEIRPAKSAFAAIKGFAKAHVLLLSFLALAIAITTYFFIKGR